MNVSNIEGTNSVCAWLWDWEGSRKEQGWKTTIVERVALTCVLGGVGVGVLRDGDGL